MISLAAERKEHRAYRVGVNEEYLRMDLTDGRTLIVPLVWFPRLWHGTGEERNNFEVLGMAHIFTGLIWTRI
jgi:hypothetical protein